MNRKLFGSVCCILLSWCLLLNAHEVSGVLLLLIGATVLLLTGTVSSFWRFIAISLLTGILFDLFLRSGTIDIFYPHIRLFLYVLSIHIGIFAEMTGHLSAEVNSFLFLCFTGCLIVFYVIALVLPGELYTLFSKANLYDLIAFIFLPHTAVLSIASAYDFLGNRAGEEEKEIGSH